jgi:DNA-binding CsgD family transcriptional regulator
MADPPSSSSPAGATGATCALTAREREVLKLRAKGLVYKEIADRMRISAHTVKNHLESIHRKLAVHNTIEAINAASRNGISLE